MSDDTYQYDHFCRGKILQVNRDLRLQLAESKQEIERLKMQVKQLNEVIAKNKKREMVPEPPRDSWSYGFFGSLGYNCR